MPDLRARLAALVAEMRAAHHGVWVEYWADRLAALLREPPLGLSENVIVGPREPPATPVGCEVQVHISRVCERGTRGCTVRHGAAAPEAK